MTPEQLAELRRLAEAATPGPWNADNDDESASVTDSRTGGVVASCGGEEFWSPHPEDSDYIAAANPATMLALLDEIERLKREAFKLKIAMHLEPGKFLEGEGPESAMAMAILERDEAIKRADNERIDHECTVKMLHEAKAEAERFRHELHTVRHEVMLMYDRLAFVESSRRDLAAKAADKKNPEP